MSFKGTIFSGLGKALRLLRDKRGKSQKEVAAAAGITPPMLSAYENERTSPEMETLDKILDLGLQASLADLTWALDVVNDRLPRRESLAPGLLPEVGYRPGSRGGGSLDRQLTAMLSTGGESLPPALEEGYAEMVRALYKISRFVFESVVRPPERGGGEE